MEKKYLDDNNLLLKFKKHSHFKRYVILKISKFKAFSKFQKSFTPCKWGVMCMTYKTKL
jgi:hypothetical protein